MKYIFAHCAVKSRFIVGTAITVVIGFEIRRKITATKIYLNIVSQALKPETMLKYISVTVIFHCYFEPCVISILFTMSTTVLKLVNVK